MKPDFEPVALDDEELSAVSGGSESQSVSPEDLVHEMQEKIKIQLEKIQYEEIQLEKTKSPSYIPVIRIKT